MIMTKYELERRIGELYAQIYWHERGTFPKDNITEIRQEYIDAVWQFEEGDYVDEVNAQGNIIHRNFHPDGDRYQFDFGMCSREKGWIQFDTDQDAWYFGVWVNPIKRQIFTYAEGDMTLVECPTVESFKAELKVMNEFYDPPPPAFVGIDIDNGTVTEFYDERPGLEV